MDHSSAKASPPLGRWLGETAWEEPYHGQVEGRPALWLHLDVPGQTLSPPERWITKRSSQSSSDATDVARDAPAADSHRHTTIASASACALSCRECAEQFTGIWRDGSLARHLRLKHRSDLNVPYSCSVCHKVYARSDALLKHERRKHPELLRAPPAPRPSHSRSSSFETQGPSRVYPPRNLHPDEYYTQELLPVASSRAVARPQHPSNHSTSPKVSAQHPLVVQTGLGLLASELENSLDPNASSLLDNNLVCRWGPILLQLRDRGSGLDASFRNALEDIRAEVRKSRTDNSTLVRRQPSTSDAITSRTHTNKRNKFRTSTSRAGSSRALPGSNPRQLSRVSGHLNAANNSNCGPSVHVLESEDDGRLKTLDCPVYKHHVMQNLRSPCGGGKFTYLAEIRHHLQPGRSQTHHGFPRFLRNCRTCNQDFVEEHTWIAHGSHGCMPRTRHRTEDSKVESWARLYVALYPSTPHVPSPFSGELSWLPLDVSSLLPTYRRVFTPPDFNIVQTPSSFLDDYQSSQNSTPLFTPVTGSASHNVRYPHSSASTASLDPNYSPYSQFSPTDYPPQQNINTASQAGYSPEFGNQITNQTMSSVAYAIILRDVIALASRLYEEGERSLPPMELNQLVDEIEEEFHFRLRPHGRNNMESGTPVTPMASTPGAPGPEDRTPVDYRPPYEHQPPFTSGGITYQMSAGTPLPSPNYSASPTSEPSSAPNYRPANHSSLQVPTRWATSPGHDSGYVSNRSDPSDQPRPSTSSHRSDPASERGLHPLRPHFSPGTLFPADGQLCPAFQFRPQHPHFYGSSLNFAPSAAQARSVEDAWMDESSVSD